MHVFSDAISADVSSDVFSDVVSDIISPDVHAVFRSPHDYVLSLSNCRLLKPPFSFKHQLTSSMMLTCRLHFSSRNKKPGKVRSRAVQPPLWRLCKKQLSSLSNPRSENPSPRREVIPAGVTHEGMHRCQLHHQAFLSLVNLGRRVLAA